MFYRAAILLAGLFFIGVIALIGWPEAPYERYEADAELIATAEAYGVPPMPSDWKSHSFTTTDGTILRWGETGNRASAKASLLIVPGYTATLDMYGEQIDALAERGFHVMAIDLRGQGWSSRHRTDYPEKLWVDDFSTYSDDLNEFLGRHGPTLSPLIVYGISFGGHVAMRLATDHPGVVDGLYLVAPAIVPKAGDMDYAQAYRIMELSRRLGKGERYVVGNDNWAPISRDFTIASRDMCASDPKRLWMRDAIFILRPEQRVGGPTNQWGAEFFESSEYLRADGRLSRVTVPTVMIKAEVDTFVENDAIDAACADMSDCRTVLIPETGHCLMQENDDVLDTLYSEVTTLAERMTGDVMLEPSLTEAD